MREPDLRAALQTERRAVDRELRRVLAAQRGVPARLGRAMRHSVTGGGKRLRPVLMLWCHEACAGALKVVNLCEV